MNEHKHNENFVDHEVLAITRFEQDTLMFMDGLECELKGEIFSGNLDLELAIFCLQQTVSRLELEKAQIAEDMAKHLPGMEVPGE
jgi:hypothetical protein